MSALTDLFTSLANKIRSKLGTTSTYTPAQAIAAIDSVYTKGVTDTKKGDAAVGDVLAPKTFTSNTAGVNQTGTMPNRGAVSPSGLNCGGSYTIPAGYHNGSGKVTANSLASQTGVDSGRCRVTAGTMVSGYQGWVNGTKITGTFAAQAGSASPSTKSQTKYPDSGKYFNSFTVSAISPQRSAGAAATLTGIDSTGPYVYFPYGWWPNANATYGNYTRMTAAQAVTACPKEERTAAASRTKAVVVTPNTGKLMSKFTVKMIPNNSGTVAITKRAKDVDLGTTTSYRYADTTGVPNSNSEVFTPNSNQYNSQSADMGATNKYRYVNTTPCYKAGNDYGSSVTNNTWLGRRAKYQTNVTRGNYYQPTFDGIIICFSGNCNNIDVDDYYEIEGKTRYSTNFGWSVVSFRAHGWCSFRVINGEAEVFFIQ